MSYAIIGFGKIDGREPLRRIGGWVAGRVRGAWDGLSDAFLVYLYG